MESFFYFNDMLSFNKQKTVISYKIKNTFFFPEKKIDLEKMTSFLVLTFPHALSNKTVNFSFSEVE